MKITELILREEWTPTPEQVKWLGNADRKDPYILARMPGEKPPLSYFKDPDDQAKAKELNVGTNNLNTVKSVVGGKPDEPIFSTSPNSNFGTFGNASTSRGFSGTNQAGKDPGPGDGAAPYQYEPYPNQANQSGNSSTDSSTTASTAAPAYKPFSNDDALDAANKKNNTKPGETAVGGEGNPTAAAAGSAAAGGAAAAGNSRGKTGDPEKDIGPPAELTTALTQLNNILKKYKVTTESRNNLKRRMISENLHEFSPAEQIRIFTILIENKPEQLNEFIAPLVKGLGRMFGVGKGAKAGVRKAAKAKADSLARRSLVNKARNPIRAALPKIGGAALTGWGAYEGAKALWDWWKEPPEEKPEPLSGEPVSGDPAGEGPGAGGPAGEGPGAGDTEGQGGTVGQAVAAGFISKEDVDIIKKQLPILVRYFGLDTTSNDLKLDIKATIDGIEELQEKVMTGTMAGAAGAAGAAGQAGKPAAPPKPWGKTGDPDQDTGPLPKSVITKDGKTRERPPGFIDSMWKAYLKYLKDDGHLKDTGAMK